ERPPTLAQPRRPHPTKSRPASRRLTRGEAIDCFCDRLGQRRPRETRPSDAQADGSVQLLPEQQCSADCLRVGGIPADAGRDSLDEMLPCGLARPLVPWHVIADWQWVAERYLIVARVGQPELALP